MHKYKQVSLRSETSYNGPALRRSCLRQTHQLPIVGCVTNNFFLHKLYQLKCRNFSHKLPPLAQVLCDGQESNGRLVIFVDYITSHPPANCRTRLALMATLLKAKLHFTQTPQLLQSPPQFSIKKKICFAGIYGWAVIGIKYIP